MKKHYLVLLMSFAVLNSFETNQIQVFANETLYPSEVKKDYHEIDFTSIKANPGTPVNKETINQLIFDSKCLLRVIYCEGLFWDKDGLKFGSNKCEGELTLSNNTFEYGELSGYAYNSPVYDKYGDLVDWKCDKVKIEINCDGPCTEYEFPTNDGKTEKPSLGSVQFTSLMNDPNNPSDNKPHLEIDIYSTSNETEEPHRFVITKLSLWNSSDPRKPVFKNFIYDCFTDTYKKHIELKMGSTITETEITSTVIAFDPTTNQKAKIITESVIDKSIPKRQIYGYEINLCATIYNLVSYATISVNYVDETPPIISGPDTLTFGYTSPKAHSEILANYTASDNITNKISLSITNDTYTPNKDKIGAYTLTINAKDSSNNCSEKVVDVFVVDDCAPIIVGPSRIIKGTSINLSTSDIYKMYTAIDDICRTVPIEILSNNYEDHESIEGTYEIVLVAYDNFENKVEKTLTIDVNSSVNENAYMIDDEKIVTYAGNLLSVDVIQDFLKLDELNIITDSYSNSYDVIGTYNYEVSTNDNESLNLVIEVIDNQINSQNNMQKKSFFAKVWEQFSNFWIKLWNLITKGKWSL